MKAIKKLFDVKKLRLQAKKNNLNFEAKFALFCKFAVVFVFF